MKLSGSHKDIKRYSKAIDLLKVQCKVCGRKVPFVLNEDRKPCSWCGNYVYKNDKVEFKYKMKGALRNESKRIQEANQGKTTKSNN